MGIASRICLPLLYQHVVHFSKEILEHKISMYLHNLVYMEGVDAKSHDLMTRGGTKAFLTFA